MGIKNGDLLVAVLLWHDRLTFIKARRGAGA